MVGTVIIEFEGIKGFGFACKDVTKVDENNFLKTCHFVIIYTKSENLIEEATYTTLGYK